MPPASTRYEIGRLMWDSDFGVWVLIVKSDTSGVHIWFPYGSRALAGDVESWPRGEDSLQFLRTAEEIQGIMRNMPDARFVFNGILPGQDT